MPEPAAQPQSPAPPLKPSERQWVVNTAHRLPDGTVVPNTQGMEAAMLDLASILQRIGGIVSIATRRVEVDKDTGQVETTSIVIRWQQFSPLERGGAAPDAEALPAEPSEEPEKA